MHTQVSVYLADQWWNEKNLATVNAALKVIIIVVQVNKCLLQHYYMKLIV